MKKLFSFVILTLSFTAFASFASAQGQGGVVQKLEGTAQVTTAGGASHSLSVGQAINEGDVLSTGAGSLLIIQFVDGQVLSLVANTKVTIQNYNYDQTNAANSKVLFVCNDGGMRTATGLIGKANPNAVHYKAANAVIDIHGTDIIIMTNDGNVILQVLGGVATLIVDGMVRVVSLGQAGIKTKDGRVTGANAEQLAQTLMMLFPNNTNIQAVATDLNAQAPKIDAATTAVTGTTVINAQTKTDTKKTDTNTNTGNGQTPPSNK